MSPFSVVANLVEYHNANDAVPRIISFATRKEGWNFSHGRRPSTNIVFKSLLAALAVRESGIVDTGAFLNDDGSIMVTGYYGKTKHVEITCQIDEQVRVVLEENDSVVLDEEYINLEYGRQVLIDWVQKWGDAGRLLEYTISTTSILNSADSRAIVSQNHQVTMGYPSFAPTVQLPQVAQYAPTFVGTTAQLLAHRQFSGNSAARTFQVVPG
jgi:hypothetical protein